MDERAEERRHRIGRCLKSERTSRQKTDGAAAEDKIARTEKDSTMENQKGERDEPSHSGFYNTSGARPRDALRSRVDIVFVVSSRQKMAEGFFV